MLRPLRIVELVVAATLAVLAARRLLFLVAASWPRATRIRRSDDRPTLLVALAARNEERRLPRALEALDRTDYPGDRLHVTVVDDGSTDGTTRILDAYAETRDHVKVVRRDGSPNKAAALNAALAVSARTDLVVVCDADQAPTPDCFQRLAAAFVDPRIGAAAAYLRPANADAGAVARYTAVETWVHQLVTSEAKDRLGLDPPMLGGGSMYRREALEAIGGFPEWAFAEDLGSSLLLPRAGWRTRFVREAVVDNLVPVDWREYWSQHVRWTRSLYQAAEHGIGGTRLSIRGRIEQVLHVTGYVDRLALGGALVLVAARRMRLAIPGAYLAVAGTEVVVAMAKAGVGRRMPAFLVSTAVVFPLDAAGALVATAHHIARRPLQWRSPRVAR